MLLVIVTMIVTSPMLTRCRSAGCRSTVKATKRSSSSPSWADSRRRERQAWSVVAASSTAAVRREHGDHRLGTSRLSLALVNGGFLPRIIAVRNPTFNTPHIAVAIATVVPVLVILFSAGEMKLLGDMYAFGLLGAFVFSSLSLDGDSLATGRRDPGFWLGVFTTLMVMVAWAINLVEKPLATYFGGAVTIAGMLVAVGVRRAWFVDLLVQIPVIQRLQARAYRASEDFVEDELKGLMTLAEAVEVKPLYSSSTLLALRDEAPPQADPRRHHPRQGAGRIRALLYLRGRMAGTICRRDTARAQ